uniref:Uncharacterized protein n=1 Tax=Oryza brachyantha TaxID=4533 RepID=J3MJK6_ORYBR
MMDLIRCEELSEVHIYYGIQTKEFGFLETNANQSLTTPCTQSKVAKQYRYSCISSTNNAHKCCKEYMVLAKVKCVDLYLFLSNCPLLRKTPLILGRDWEFVSSILKRAILWSLKRTPNSVDSPVLFAGGSEARDGTAARRPPDDVVDGDAAVLPKPAPANGFMVPEKIN